MNIELGLQQLYSASSNNMWSLYPKYSVVDISCLLEFIVLVRSPCTNCNGQFHVVELQMEGHCIKLKLDCGRCPNQCKIWSGSKQYPDQSYEVNRDFVAAYDSVGGDRSKYFTFTSELRCGTYNATSYDNTLKLLAPFIFEQEDNIYKQNINDCNQDIGGTILGFDTQYSRSQRYFGSAPYATTSFFNHQPGKNYGKILYQAHISTHQMKEMKMKGTESKDKLATKEGLQKMVEKLDSIVVGICDGSSIAESVWQECINKNSKHIGAALARCMWHKAKSIPKDFSRKVYEHRTRLQQKEGNKQYELTYPEFKELQITPTKVKSYWIKAVKSCNGEVEQMIDEWKSMIDHYQCKFEDSISKKSEEKWEEWMDEQLKNAENYKLGLLTDIEESFHNSSLKYWKKGKAYQLETWCRKRAWSALDWNENFGKEAKKHTNNFRKQVREKFHEFLKSRVKGTNHETFYWPKYEVVAY